jgi:hypothetical protein
VTTYTTPHSLPILETSDKIAASGDGLREDLNAISRAANAAITAESVAIRGSFTISNIALDTDGVPYFSPGSMTVKVLQDTDGVPYYQAA